MAGALSWANKAKLLPGGEYMLFQNSGRLQCWKISEDKLIRTHACSMNDASVFDFAADIIEDDEAVILTCQRTSNEPRQNFVEITILGLEMETRDLSSSTVLTIPTPLTVVLSAVLR
ncbi:hypothetical protein C8F04DRAFT_1263739 [Mycena alexandri]|uniref:Uncharacterized protein n=1 Tax=Mycena alexandri TaxID=1745969 RepID=A0AAD6WZU0_9AGAR|nr:hypothetical protein C8F04DRAFT_1263739 [Mycena alexandri]